MIYYMCKGTVSCCSHDIVTHLPGPVVCQTCSHQVYPHHCFACCPQWSQTGGLVSVNGRMAREKNSEDIDMKTETEQKEH